MSIFDISGTTETYISTWLPGRTKESSDDSEFLTDEKIQELFKEFQIDYQKSYDGKAEENHRFNIFRENLLFIHKHNQQPNIAYTMAVNEFADMSPKEFEGSRFGYAASTASKLGEHHIGFHLLNNEELPESVDWSHLGAVTKVKNQANCGSCYSFSGTGAMEGRLEIVTKKLQSLSEQQIVDCSREEGNMGCDGGLMDNVFTYVQKHGLCSEEDYSYAAKVGECKADSCTPVIHPKDIVGIIDVPPNNDRAMMEAVAKGPVAVAIEADQAAFQFYKGGVLTAACGDKLDHGVLLVGYGNYEGTDYWKIKNSWGPRWGDEGYILLERGKAAGEEGECGVLMQGSYPVFDVASLQDGVYPVPQVRSFRALQSNDNDLQTSGASMGAAANPLLLGVLATVVVVRAIFGGGRGRREG